MDPTNLEVNPAALNGYIVQGIAINRALLDVLLIQTAEIRARLEERDADEVLEEINKSYLETKTFYIREMQEIVSSLPGHLKTQIDEGLRGKSGD